MKRKDASPDATLPEETRRVVEERLRAAAAGNRVACAQAFAIARECGAAPLAVGRVADALGIRIARCQLGCF